jgi:transcriptional regulator with XRE-family HTH domain
MSAGPTNKGLLTVSDLGSRLRQAIRGKNMTIEKFAGEADIKRTTLQDYLANAAKPSADALTKMIRAGLDVSWILTGEVQTNLLTCIADHQKFVPVNGPLASDPEVCVSILIRCLNKVEKDPDVSKRLPDLMFATWSTFSLVAAATQSLAPNLIQRARAEGASAEVVAELLIQALFPSERPSTFN